MAVLLSDLYLGGIMNSYHEVEQFQRKAGQPDFPFRDTGGQAFQQRETGWSLIDQVAAGVSPSFSSPRKEEVEPAPRQTVSTPVSHSPDAQDAALDRFASLLQARHRREAEEVRGEPDVGQSLKQLLRRIAAPDESRSAQC